jgi:NADPH:quinone reductase-like Zn-dependent oxidoreductase/acyl carrier protein
VTGPGTPGTPGQLALAPCPQAAGPLAPGQVRVAVRAAGLSLPDVLTARGTDPGGIIGSEIAGIIIETGPGVTGLAAGDRVLGLADGGAGPLAVTDARLLVPVPAGWSFAQAAAVPAAFTAAWYALADLAAARPGQRVLIHAEAGGAAMAAVAVAGYLGLEVFGTASPGRHQLLAGLGLDPAHIVSSPEAAAGERFTAAAGGAGMDIVLNSPAGPLAGASLRLLRSGGTFIELGKTGLPDLAAAAAHQGVTCRVLDLAGAGPARLGEILAKVTGLLAAGVLAPLPVRAWDVRRAAEAFGFMSQARHTAKIVLAIPPDPAAPRQAGTVLVTGGTGTLGGLAARHLAAAGRARQLLLASRSGPAAPGAAPLAAAIAGAGAGATVAACDTADPGELAALLDRATAVVPLTGVIHTAGVLDDATIGSLTPDRVRAVMRPKTDTAWHLHQLTRGADLDDFVLYSSAAATFGGAGQGNYAAANAFLDALAARRQAAGLSAVSLAWGLWAEASGITARLADIDRARITRGGMTPLAADEGLALLDTALGRDEAQLVTARLDIAGLRAQAAGAATADIPALWRGLAGGLARPSAGTGAGAGVDPLRQRLAGLVGPDRDRLLLDLVRQHAAAVLGHASAEAVDPARPFTDHGFDSLTAVELRSRLSAATGLRLPATLVFDYPTPAALAGYLGESLSLGIDGGTDSDESNFRKALASIPLSRFRDAGLVETLLRLASSADDAFSSGENKEIEAIDSLDVESLVRMALNSDEDDF